MGKTVVIPWDVTAKNALLRTSMLQAVEAVSKLHFTSMSGIDAWTLRLDHTPANSQRIVFQLKKESTPYRMTKTWKRIRRRVKAIRTSLDGSYEAGAT